MGLTDKGISLASGFKYQAGRPLDVRSIVENTTERDELISSNAAYLGMRVYVKSVDKSYYYTASGWKEVPVGAMYTHPSTHPATMITEDTNHRFMTDAERTKLSNAPTTINGTKFNGTASITTANWGTTRSIYIADSDATNTGAAVSVNGGANATLKLPATIKASLTGNASTATKLATARSINGTNFDGSGAITTANWGTARNIYIADSDATNTGAAVSVNGGGNATLKLPATIKATLTGNASSASQVYGTATNPSTATSYFLPFHSGSTSGNKSMLTNDGIRYNTLEGTTSANGVSALELGNNVASGTAGNKYGVTRLYGTSSGYTEVKPSNNTTSNITLTLPSSTGTLALTSNNVASATKLATARSINGTNFDGTSSC